MYYIRLQLFESVSSYYIMIKQEFKIGEYFWFCSKLKC